MRLPIASDLKSRDGTTAKDAGIKNAIIETDGEESAIRKRPGALSLGSAGTGVAQLLACYNGQLRSIIGNTLADLTVGTALDYGNVYALPASASGTWLRAAYGNGTWLIKSLGGNECALSVDGESWTSGANLPFTPSLFWDNPVFGAGLFLVPSQDATNRYATSPDGVTWTQRTFPFDSNTQSAKFNYANGLFIACGYLGQIYTSPDGINWTGRTVSNYPVGVPYSLDTAVYGNGVYAVSGYKIVAAVYHYYVSTTTDFVTWTHSSISADPGLLTFDGTNFIVACGLYSSDAVTWSASAGIPAGLDAVCAASLDGMTVALAYDASDNEYSYLSTDGGATWSLLTSYGNIYAFEFITAGLVGTTPMFVSASEIGDSAAIVLAGSSEPAVTVDSSQAITSIEPSLGFFAEVSGQAQSQNVIVLKNSKQAWTYDGTTLTAITDADYPGWSVVTPTSITRSGAVATVTMPAAVNWQSGSSITISGAVQAEYNGTHVVNVTDSTHFTFPVSGTPVTPATGTITATGGRTTVPGIVYLDGYFFVMDRNGVIYNCALGDATSWNALDFLTANIEPGSGVAIAKSQNYIIAMKSWSTEFFYDAGNSVGSPLSPVMTAFTLIGCASGESVANIDGTVIWVSKTRQKGRAVHIMAGLQQQKVSTSDIERILNANTMENVYSYGVKISGHTFYVLGLKDSGLTLVYDMTSNTWAQWTSLTAQAPKSCSITSANGIATAICADHGNSDGSPVTIAGAAQSAYNGTQQVRRIDANTFTFPVSGSPASPATGSITATGYDETYFKYTKYVFCAGRDLVLHESTGELCEITETVYQDSAKPINVVARTGKIDGGNIERKTNSQVKIIGNKNGGAAALRWSDDDYTTNSAFRTIDLSSDQARLSRCGSFRRRSYELRHVGNSPVQVSALELEINQEK